MTIKIRSQETYPKTLPASLSSLQVIMAVDSASNTRRFIWIRIFYEQNIFTAANRRGDLLARF